ncbi:hypothetical protein NOAM109506_03315 [Nosocomiicoccus ampullae]|uniref:Uncharacterized protein n=1 Tax=Nosocomiicoccus ampullae TaxID=489910 RepID=A0A9Q2HEV6_9STAP|nr:hypothetical protein [Nosocomiicoccus ampullae]
MLISTLLPFITMSCLFISIVLFKKFLIKKI